MLTSKSNLNDLYNQTVTFAMRAKIETYITVYVQWSVVAGHLTATPNT